MRVLMLHNRYVIRGGEDESTDMEVELLRASGCEVTLLELDNRSISGNNLLRTGVETIWSTRAYKWMFQKLQEHPYDLVHIQNFFPQFSPSVHYAAKAAGKPVIQALRNYRLLCVNGVFHRDGHTCEDCMGKSIPWPGVVHRCYRNSLPGSLTVAGMLTAHRVLHTWQKKVDVFVTLSNFARDKLIEGGLPSDKIVVKPNFVYPDPGIGTDARHCVVLVGRLVEEKGVLVVVQAWNRLGIRIPLKIVGDGPLAASIRNSVRHMPWVEVLNRTAVSEIFALMKQARFVLFPTELYETFGRVIVEAYATGTPVIASNIGAGCCLIVDGKSGLLFRPGDADDLARKVRWMWEHPQEVSAMGTNARREYEDRYTAQQNLAMLRIIYERAINANRLSVAGRPSHISA
jgi:glycosyltransferase involved in cell wall biosynthesis